MTRQQTMAIAAAGIVVAILGLGLLVLLVSLRAELTLAQLTSQTMHGQMQVSTVFEALSHSGGAAQTYLSK